MSPSTIEAPDATSEQEAAAALELQDAARLAQEAAATGMTQAEREATAEHDGGSPAKPPARKRRAPQQGNLAGGWEDLIGGNQPSESKVKVVGGSIQPVGAPDTIRKGTVHRILVDVVATGYSAKDRLDKETGEVSSTTETRELKITGARFLQPHEYIADDEGAGEESE